MTDLGTGSYTVFSQIAAEMFGVPIEQISMELGDSDIPAVVGLWRLVRCCQHRIGDLRRLHQACEPSWPRPPASMQTDAEFADGRDQRQWKVDAAGVTRWQERSLVAKGVIKPGKMKKAYSQQAYGAFFAEVAVDTESGEVRLRRMLGVFAAGRILNAKTARSQALGGMIWGVGAALTEDAVIDPRHGQFVNRDLADYHVPVHADIPAIDAVFLPEVDDKTNPLKTKGLGELGISGAGAAAGERGVQRLWRSHTRLPVDPRQGDGRLAMRLPTGRFQRSTRVLSGSGRDGSMGNASPILMPAIRQYVLR